MIGKSLQTRSVKSDNLLKPLIYTIMNEQIKYFPPLVEVMDVNAEGVLCASGANAPEWDVEEW